MIIGVDETGDFNPASERWHFCIAALVRPENVVRFTVWEKTIDKQGRDHVGEVKGNLLSEDQLGSFVHSVLLVPPVVRVRPVALRPAANPTSAIKAHRAASLANFLTDIERLRKQGDTKTANLAEQAKGWWNNRPDSDYLWFTAMSTCVGHAFFDAIVQSHEQWRDSELMGLRILVDNKFIKRTNTAATDTAARGILSFIQNDARDLGRGPLGKTLRKMELVGHPFARLCYTEGQWYFLPFLQERSTFDARSGEHPEVRIADVLCTIFGKANAQAPSSAIKALHDACLKLVGMTGKQTWVRISGTERDPLGGPRKPEEP